MLWNLEKGFNETPDVHHSCVRMRSFSLGEAEKSFRKLGKDLGIKLRFTSYIYIKYIKF